MYNILDNIYLIGSEKNCIVNIILKIIMFWWLLNEGNENVYRCGLMDFNGNFIIGNMFKIDKVGYDKS